MLDAPTRGDAAELADLDAVETAARIRRKELKAEEVLDAAIRRMETLNPRLDAMIHAMHDEGRKALREASPDAPFYGVPFLLKDLLTAWAGQPLSCGSRYLRRYVAPADSELAARYRRAGLAPIGKTNTPEFGLMQVTEPDAFGPSRNPWDESRTPGGSSGGSGAAVAARMVPMASGGDGGGSLRIPAACCGVFAMKPTRGRLPTGPVVGELWRGYVVEGVISRSVRDSAALLDVVQGPDVGAPYAAPTPTRPFAQELGAKPGKLRIALAIDPPLPVLLHPEARAAALAAAKLCADLGHEVVEAPPPIDGMAFYRDYVAVVAANLSAELRLLEPVVGRAPRARDLEPTTRLLDLLGRTLSAGAYEAAAQRLAQASRRILRWQQDFDALLTPTLAQPPLKIGECKPSGAKVAVQKLILALRAGRLLTLRAVLDETILDAFRFTPHVAVQNVTGQPAMSVPLHWTAEGLPLGVQFAGRFGDEATLFRLAAQLEEAAPWAGRRPPISA